MDSKEEGKGVMKSCWITKYTNDSKAIKCGDVPIPQVKKPTDVLVKIIAAGLNPLDFKIRSGNAKTVLPYSFPIYLGREFSGVVEEVGKDVKKFKKGDSVFCRSSDTTAPASLSEFIVEDESLLATKPSNVSHVEAAGLPLACLTVYQALIEKGSVQKGQKVFIAGGAGGVGSLAVQFAKNVLEAEVTTTASEKKIELVKKLGADHVIDYKKEKYEDTLKDQDVGFDLVNEFNKCIKTVKPNGKLIAIAGIPSLESVAHLQKEFKMSWYVPKLLGVATYQPRHAAHKKNVEYITIFCRGSGEQLEKISGWVEAGKIVPVMDKVFTGLESVSEALAYLEAGHCTGKVVIRVSDDIAPTNAEPSHSKEEE